MRSIAPPYSSQGDLLMKEVVIVSATRIPVGKFQGSLQSFSAPRLGALVVREAVRRAGVEPTQIDECIMGCVLQAGLGQNPARQAALYGGLSNQVAALTINKVCGSSLKAVALAAQAIQTENAEMVVAGGMESMSNAPYLLPQARSGYRMGNGVLVDAMIQDGLWEVYNNFHMGVGAEKIAAKYGISREEQDAFAAESHRRAALATAQGFSGTRFCRWRFRQPKKARRRRSLQPTSRSAPRQPLKSCPGSSRPFRREAQ